MIEINQKFIPEGWNTNDKIVTKEKLIDALNEGSIMQGRVAFCDQNYNLYIENTDGLNAIIPRKEIEAICKNSLGEPRGSICSSKVNRLVQFQVKDFIEDNNTVILSRKNVGIKAAKWAMNDLKPGDIVGGIVTNICPFGAFVEIGGGISGLLHIEDISVVRIKSPFERFKIGQKIQVMIKCIRKENNTIDLTYKELLGTWEENVQTIKEGKIVQAIVRENERNNKGIFVELTPNLVGLAEYTDGVEYGQKVNVLVKKIIPEKKKVKLIFVK